MRSFSGFRRRWSAMPRACLYACLGHTTHLRDVGLGQAAVEGIPATPARRAGRVCQSVSQSVLVSTLPTAAFFTPTT